MRRSTIIGAMAGVAIIAAAWAGLEAQQTPQGSPTFPERTAAFDSKQFFDQLRLNGVSMSEGFDGAAFFEKLRLQGVSDRQPLDAEAFFEKLRLEGVSIPAGFDARRFFDDLAARGVSAPAMVMPPGGGPTIAECRAGWNPSGRWDQALFDRLCEGRR